MKTDFCKLYSHYNDIAYEIFEHIGIIAKNRTAYDGDKWNKELNLVAWNGGQPKIDIREWDASHERMTRGITLFEETAEKLAEALTAYKNKEDKADPEAYEPKGDEVTFDIVEPIGQLESYRAEWTKEANLVSWNGNNPKVDIRDWNDDHTRMSRGITLTIEEAERLAKLLTARYSIK